VPVADGNEHFGKHSAYRCGIRIVALNEDFRSAIHDADAGGRFLNSFPDFAVLAKEFNCLVLAI
jgi:hypothetical protein